MVYAQQYLSGLKRSVMRLWPSRSPLWPADGRPLGSLTAWQGAAPNNVGDPALCIEFFRTRLAAAGFLSLAEARRAAAVYRCDKKSWRRELLAETLRFCNEGLPVYALQAGPLAGGLDWPALSRLPCSDRLYRLRPHRFGFLPRLALAACLGADVLPALQATLAGWIRQGQMAERTGDAYFSNLVVVYRLLALTWAAPFLAAKAEDGDETAAQICLQLFHVLAADCRHLAPRLGEAAPNNHRLADSFAAWLLSVCYPELVPGPETPETPDTLEQAWHAELARQFQEDGTNFEQSLHYHELGCELALAYLVIALRRGKPPPAPVLKMIARMLRFQAALADRNGNGFALGDTTDDPLLPLDAGSSWARGAWRILYRELFDRSFQETAETAAGAERAHWLLVALRGIELPLPVTGLQTLGQQEIFSSGGYVAFRDEERDDYLLFRSGPRPDTPVFPGHAMSDLLTVYWNVEGKAVLEPAGTYSYAAASLMPDGGPFAPRHYFRSPAGHNGPVLGGHDPLGRPKGRFRDHDSGARAVTRWRSLEGVLGWAEARLQEAGPLNGWRRGILRIPGRYTLVYDLPPSLPDDADLACHWQFAPQAAVSLPSSRRAAVRLDGRTAYFCASQGIASMNCIAGQKEPPAGWVSRRYGQIEAAPQLICRLQPGAAAVAFAVGLCGGEGPPHLEVPAAGDTGISIVVRQEERCAIAVFGRLSTVLQNPFLDIEFDGEGLWLELAGDSVLQLRALGLRRLTSSSLGLALGAADPEATPPAWLRLVHRADRGGLCGHWVASGRG
ncbi:heparinase II/III domain-containing protein [Pelagibius marinus]|uniref:heparinase II/III domain-containing protein n=1 Tax=Pelagibius marinus TaxID=2762760 RepID=UPI001872F254|nr:heparinase II/III family protein [Pelagibius marinus]